MEETRTYCFAHPSGEDIYLFSLHNSKGTKVQVTNYGGIITSFVITVQDGNTNDIVLGFDKVEDYMSEEYLSTNPFFGAAIGRYGNRIKDGKFSINDKEFLLEKNMGPNHLHGGRSGFDKKVWKVISFTASTLVLQYKSFDGEEGYPGNLDVILKFALNDENELSYEYTASTDRPTIINLTHHSYFNLNNGSGKIDDHFVKINSSTVLEQDEDFAVTGNSIPVENTFYDFRHFKKINKDWNPQTGYDQSFVRDQTSESLPAAEAFSEKSGIKLQVYTTEPVVHLYTGKWVPKITGKNGTHYGEFSGFCLETQIHPNAINVPSFPDTILRPGETYHHKTKYRVTLM